MGKRSRRAARAATSLAAGAALALSVPLCAAPATPPTVKITADAADAQPEVDTTFQQFTDSPFARLSNPPVFTPPPPLFEPFNTLANLEPQAQTSRSTLTTRAIIAFPVLTAKVGDELDVPLLFQSGPPVTAFNMRMYYDPKILQAVSVSKGTDWPTATLDFNLNPEPIGNNLRGLNAVEFGSDALTKVGTLLTIHFRIIGEGESKIGASYFDVANEKFDSTLTIVRTGLIRASS